MFTNKELCIINKAISNYLDSLPIYFEPNKYQTKIYEDVDRIKTKIKMKQNKKPKKKKPTQVFCICDKTGPEENGCLAHKEI